MSRRLATRSLLQASALSHTLSEVFERFLRYLGSRRAHGRGTHYKHKTTTTFVYTIPVQEFTIIFERANPVAQILGDFMEERHVCRVMAGQGPDLQRFRGQYFNQATLILA